MGALVVVAYPRVPADGRGGALQRRRIHPGSNETALVAEAAGIEDAADLADDAPRLQVAGPGEDLLLRDAEGLAQRREGPRVQRKRPLHQREEAPLRAINDTGYVRHTTLPLRVYAPASGPSACSAAW